MDKMDKFFTPGMKCRVKLLIHPQTLTVQGFRSTRYWVYNYSSQPEKQQIHVSEIGPRPRFVITEGVVP